MARTTSIEGSILALLETDPGQKGLTHFELRELKATAAKTGGVSVTANVNTAQDIDVHARPPTSEECHPFVRDHVRDVRNNDPLAHERDSQVRVDAR